MAVGEADVDALLARVTSRLLTEWMAYYALEPFGEERADLRSAIVASLLANANRDPARRREPFTPQDFMPRFDGFPPEARGNDGQTWEQQKSIMQGLFGRLKKR